MTLFTTPASLAEFILHELEPTHLMTLVTRNPPHVAKAAILATIHRLLTHYQMDGMPHVSTWTTSIRHIAGFRSPDIAEYEVVSSLYDFMVHLAQSTATPTTASSSL